MSPGRIVPDVKPRSRPRIQLRVSNRAIAGVALPLAVVVLVPVVLVAGLIVGIPKSGGSPPTSGTPSRSFVSIYFTPCLGVSAPGIFALRSAAVAGNVPLTTCKLLPSGTLYFWAIVTGGASPLVYFWDFGDASGPGFGQSLYHTYPACGHYVVTVEALTPTGALSNSTGLWSCL